MPTVMPRKNILIKDWTDFKRIEGKRIALTVGIFDGIHRGHFTVFTVLREISSDFAGIPVIFTFENHPLTVLEPGRKISYITLPEEKANLLFRLGFEHVAFFRFTREFSQMKAEEFLSRIKEYCDLRALVAGYDASIGHDKIRTDADFRALAGELGFEFVRIPEVKDKDTAISSHAIRDAINRGNLELANNRLVYPFFVRGKVQSGRGIGEKLLRMPTANIVVPEEKIIPPNGVYAGAFRKDGNLTASALFTSDFGWHPSFYAKTMPEPSLQGTKGTQKQIEGHVIGRRISVKGSIVEFIFLEKIRDSIDFDDPEDLRKTMLQDIKESVRIFEKNRLKLRFLP